MNIAFFLTPKSEVAFLYDDFTVRQGLEKMRHHGYTAIPVISRNGQYVDAIREGDFLWYLTGDEAKSTPLHRIGRKNIEKKPLSAVKRHRTYEPVNITASVEQLMDKACTQNFVPVVDDLGSFIGIITRRDIIKYFYSHDRIE